MIVYRVEHRVSKYGPFCGRDYDPCILLKGVGARPEPYEDGITRFYYGVHICGVDSLEGILEWFYACLPTLVRYNYLVRAYEIDEDFIEFGVTQLVFVKDQAKMVEEIELREAKRRVYDNYLDRRSLLWDNHSTVKHEIAQ